MPEFWEFPTVSMGIGPLNAIYQAHFNKYLHNRGIVDTSGSRVWCFVGDGECDEPETLGALSLAGREQLDNLIFVVNANLQRLDGPVRGNGKIIQELEAVFRGAGWNVIKVIWGSRWDELLARDVDGVLLNKMNTTVDGEFQKLATEDGAYIREHFFGPDPRLRKLVEHLSDEELRTLPRGGHDYRKLYAAYKAATETTGQPTVILAKTIKGWALGPTIEARNSTHQIKKMNTAELKALRDRLKLHAEISDEVLERGAAVLPAVPGQPRVPYMVERRPSWAVSCPNAWCDYEPLPAPDPRRFRRVRQGFGATGGVDDDGLRCPAAAPAAGQGAGQARRADHPRRGTHLRHGRPVQGLQDLRPARPTVRARRLQADAVLFGSEGRPDPGRGHNRGRRPRGLHRGGDRLRDLRPSRWCRFTSSIRCSATSASAT